MAHKFLLLLPLLLAACATKPAKVFEDLEATPASQVIGYDQVEFAKLAKPAELNKRESHFLEANPPVLSPAPNRKSYFRVFKFRTLAKPLFFEIQTAPYRPAGFGGDFSVFEPEMVFFDESGKKLANQPKIVMHGIGSTFVDGRYQRTAWEVKPQGPAGKTLYAVLSASTDHIGQTAMLKVTQYGAAAVGVIYDRPVVLSPTGYFFVYVSDVLEK